MTHRNRVRTPIMAALVVALVACDGGTTPEDAGGGPCEVHADCDDGVFCNGAEECAPSEDDADARGCVRGDVDALCPTGEVCDDEADECRPPDCSTPDADGDGEASTLCGGADCDDDDPDRHPGASEVCDPDGIDEDCDTTTFGTRDADDDGYVDARCCNGDTCGDDCDDARAVVHPGSSEACDALDNDCDGAIDEGALRTYYLDADTDGSGDSASSVQACGPEGQYTATVGGDCDDDAPSVNPGAPEVCDAVDNDCDPETWAVGEDDDDDGFLNAACGGDDCLDSDPLAYPGADEPCNGVDNDCSGDVEDADEDGYVTPDAACTGGTYAKTDCEDTHPLVNVEYTDFEPLPYCPDEIPPCRVGGSGPYYCRASASAACSASDPAASFDWDCSGAEQREGQVSLTCGDTCAHVPTATDDDDEISPVCGGLGYNYVCDEGPAFSGTANCGTLVNHQGCCCDGPTNCSSQLFEVDRALRCR